MFLSVIFHTVVIAFDGVTIDASVEATFISAYVDTFNAIADIPLIFVVSNSVKAVLSARDRA